MPSLSRITADQLHERRWELLALTSVGAFATPLQASVVAVALPAIGSALNLSFAEAIWAQAVFLLTMAVMLVPVGRLADQYGRVHFYLAGMAVFAVGSLLCGLSTGALWLILSRIVQGAGSALLLATSAAIVTAVFPARERGRALGINVTAVYIGLSVGPPVGGLLVDTAGWRWVFFVVIPLCAVVIVWGWLLMPRHEVETEEAPRQDYAGAALLASFLICLLVPLTFAPEWGWTSARTLALLAVSACSLAAFAVVELRVEDPVLDLNLVLRNRLFAAANFAALLNYMALYAISLLTAIFLEVVQGRSAAETGWLMLSAPVVQALGSAPAGRLSDRVGSRVLTTTGMLLTAAGMVMLALMPSDAGALQVVGSLAVTGIGLAAFSAPNVSAVMGSVERRQLGIASGFLSAMRVTGQALSVAILGGIAASQLGALGGRLLLTHQAEGALAQRAIEDFASGYRLAMLTGAGLAVLGAAVSLTRGKHAPEMTGGPAPQQGGRSG